ncbi:MAG: ATP-dependent Clp protease proteolytic subunit [Anaerolineales bacterium]|uniref:ATP-dependent Clp protease proteolytic subunit n=1 Tax=Candidatus Villigracilis proximus TaxID=3140683 RepID=UPI003137143C|nr:ATP-dependent Clp protease proteolytic subunit [Anaerolineales bacterium]
MQAQTKPNKEKQPPILFNKTQTIIKQVNKMLGGTMVTYFNNPRGSVCHDDVLALFKLLEKIGKQEKIYLFLKSSGGNGQASLRIVNLLRQYCNELVAVIPLECASAATMITLGANEILMGPMAYLTPVDTSLTHALSPIDRDNDRVSVSLDELTRVVRLWQSQKSDSSENPYQELFQHVHPLVIGAVDRAESLSIMLCKELLAYHIKDDETQENIASALNEKYPSHGYPILFEEAKRIGLKVNRLPHEINSLLLELNELYSEMGQRATTDFDDTHAHGNEILNIWESTDVLAYYQQDKDWFYRTEERRWISLNDNSSWRRVAMVGRKIERSVLHIA